MVANDAGKRWAAQVNAEAEDYRLDVIDALRLVFRAVQAPAQRASQRGQLQVGRVHDPAQKRVFPYEAGKTPGSLFFNM
jgi:hypothetical protein